MVQAKGGASARPHSRTEPTTDNKALASVRHACALEHPSNLFESTAQSGLLDETLR